jgi:TetR/AcrR family transcriptional repressor of nem operon
MLAKLEAAVEAHPPAIEVDLPSLADQVFSTFEGGFILTRALDDPRRLGAQLAHLRHYLELLFRLA